MVQLQNLKTKLILKIRQCDVKPRVFLHLANLLERDAPVAQIMSACEDIDANYNDGVYTKSEVAKLRPVRLLYDQYKQSLPSERDLS